MGIISDIKDDINHIKYRYEQKKVEQERAEYVRGVLGPESQLYREDSREAIKGEIKGEDGEVKQSCIASRLGSFGPYTIDYFSQRTCEDGTSKLMSMKLKLKLNPELFKQYREMVNSGENLSTDFLLKMLSVRPEDRDSHRICMAEMDKNGEFVKGSEVMFSQHAPFDMVDSACMEFNAVQDFFKQLKAEQNIDAEASQGENADSAEVPEE